MSEQTSSTPIPAPDTLSIKTHHCRFCATLLLATTRDYDTLPRRKNQSLDSAMILPLRNLNTPSTSTSPENTQSKTQNHYTILLSSSTRDRRPTLIRREDGFEKRVFLRCGRCRVVVGYFLDGVHFPVDSTSTATTTGLEGEMGEDRAVYLLPGALSETDNMSDEEKMKVLDREWEDWFKQ
ncbi:uncharacterized protein BDV14DRAFT_182046 [Aspergillus stella-maris]|uniref:uncharacterized protein n=1 Tax=Aspergillus stella-maris TaxID=1810926 RepID=UPI003CCE2689